jgi:Ca2+-transporting ATPase
MPESSAKQVSLQWHRCAVSDALNAVGSRASGLTALEATRRLEDYGPNRLTRPRPASALKILATQFRSVVVLLLIGAMLLSMLLGDHVETIAIGIVIALNAGLGFVIELRARRAMEALLHLGATRSSVLRDGHLHLIEAELLVPGDVVEVNAGQTVPADGRVLTETDLRTNEATLTGESLPVSKIADTLIDPDTPLAERVNMVYQGTTVAAGTARVVVTETGNNTEVGRIGALTQSLPEERTPLERRLDELGHRLVWLALAVAGLVAVLGVVQGESWSLMLETAIALAVAAVPEGLPAVATITLAIGLHRMARRHALVRRLPAVEALGSTTVICTDKTRTLTSGDMTVVRVWASGTDFRLGHESAKDVWRSDEFRRTLEIAIRASRVHAVGGHAGHPPSGGDPVDLAIMKVAEQAAIDQKQLFTVPATALIPFSSERKFMASFQRRDGRIVAFVKGAPHRILEMSGSLHTAHGDEALDDETRARLVELNGRLATEGLRVLALASGDVAQPTESSLTDLTFAGFIGLMDPPAAGVREAVARLREAGLRTVMLTGDQRFTAEAIGRELGVLEADEEAVDSRELRGLSTRAFGERLARANAFSRITPENKLTIVRALQERGEIVAMLGDGVNDAPALRKADVGVAMGVRGTDVAKEAASIVLQDDRFDTIVAAVEEGRVIFDNIRKFVFYLFSCNLAEVLLLLVAALFGVPLPLLPLQILWLNLVTDTFPALALAAEPGDADVMDRPPRDPKEAILSREFLLHILLYAALITGSTFVAYLWALSHSLPHATTVAFMTLALAQIFHLGNARSARAVLSPSAAVANPFALGAVVLAVMLQLVAVYTEPLAHTLRVAPLAFEEWLVVVACSAVTAIVGQAIRLKRPDVQASPVGRAAQ